MSGETMNSRETREWLHSWNASEFLHEQRDMGRAKFPPARMEKYASDHRRVAALLENDAVGAQDLRLARMLETITAPLATLLTNPVPRYYSYTGVSVLDEFIDGERVDLDAQKCLCVLGIRGLMLEIARFETHSLVGIEPWSKDRFDEEEAARRLKVLARQFEAIADLAKIVQIPEASLAQAGSQQYELLDAYCREDPQLSAVVQFTCIPRTTFHDEVLFLRTIAEDELCFKGMYLAARQAGEAIERGLLNSAAYFISQAVAFAVMLHESFRVLQSMPPEHFADFRDATGEASAVQSFNYQRLDVALFGLNSEKISVYQRVPHLRSLLNFSSRQFASLRTLLQSLNGESKGSEMIIEAARLLDRHLLSWRGLHLSFALRYLPEAAMGTGGTAGPSYLQKFFRQSLFADTEPDFGLIEEIFGTSWRVEEIFRAHPGTRIAPPEKLWARAGRNG